MLPVSSRIPGGRPTEKRFCAAGGWGEQAWPCSTHQIDRLSRLRQPARDVPSVLFLSVSLRVLGVSVVIPRPFPSSSAQQAQTEVCATALCAPAAKNATIT